MNNEEAIKLIDDRMCFGRGKWSEHHRPVIDEYWQAGEMAIKALQNEPPRMKGRWIDYTDDGYVECPFCGSATNCDGDISELHYCFSCGADLKGGTGCLIS